MNTEAMLKAIKENGKELVKQHKKNQSVLKKIDAQLKRFILTICK